MQRGGSFLVGGWAASPRFGLEVRVLGGRPAGKAETGQQTFPPMQQDFREIHRIIFS
jgi:hypothetical protein